MAYKKIVYESMLDSLTSKSIVININHLNKGNYILKIMHKNKVIKTTTFKK